MRIKLQKYKFILLSVFLVTGLSITGWALAFHYNDKAITFKFQKELKNDIQEANAIPPALDHNNTIMVLVCAGLIGFFGVRRQSKTLKNLVRVRHPESRATQIPQMKIRLKGRSVPKR